MSYYQTASSSFVSSRGTRSTSRDNSWRRNRNTVLFSPSKSLGPVAHTVLVVLMLAVLGLMYLTQITKTTAYSYQLNDVEAKKSALSAAKEDLEVENARLQALERVKQSEVAKTMAKPSSTSFANE